MPSPRFFSSRVRSETWFWAAVVVSLAVSLTPWARIILYPYDIRVLFLIDRGQSDAATMARIFLLPSWVWATAWMLMSVAMLGATLWMTRARTLKLL